MKQIKKFILVMLGFLAMPFWAEAKSSDITLYGTSVSPFVRKVQNVLDYKSLDYDQEEILPKSLALALNQDVLKRFDQASPLGKIPAMSHGGLDIADSAVITAYIEKMWPMKNVYPLDAKNLSRALWIEKYADTVITRGIHNIFVERIVKPQVLGEKPDEKKVQELVNQEMPKVLTYLNDYLRKHKTPYFAGFKMSIADFAVVHHLIDIEASSQQWRNGKYPELEDFYLRMLKDPIILKSLPKDFLKK